MFMISDAARQANHSPRGQHIHITGKGRSRRDGWRAAILILAAGLGASMTAQAAIPAGERQVLLNLYTGTNGAAWANHSGWNGAPGTECTWYGITCDIAGQHVTQVSLYDNNLDGPLPSLVALAKLAYFGAESNQLTGPILTFSGLADLQVFDVGHNQLTGPIPSLAGLTNLHGFFVYDNHLTGPIPSLAGLANLSNFEVAGNHLTGPVPSLADLTNLKSIRINDNQLRGPMPPAPSPSMLQAGASQLCSNYLDPVPNADWDAATGETPWYQGCRPVDTIFADGFDY